MKKITKILLASLSCVLFFSAVSYCEVSVNDFSGLQSAVSGPDGDIKVTVDEIIFTGAITVPSSAAVNIGSLAGGTLFGSDGLQHRHFLITGASSLSFDSVSFDGASLSVVSYSTSSFGGSLFFSSSSGTFSGKTGFTNNTANSGGAVYAEKSALVFDSEVIFSSNSAFLYGGAFYLTNSLLNFNSGADFSDNFANAGSALYIANGSTVAARGLIEFKNNTSSAGYTAGGAINILSSSMQADAALFSGNKSLATGVNGGTGGGIYSWLSSLEFGTAEFLYNETNGYGGAFYSYYSTYTFTGDAAFTGNTASGGGAFYVWLTSISFSGSTVFSSNTALGSSGVGGAFHAYSNSKLTFNNVVFSGNRASTAGGAFSLTGSAAAFKGEVDFISNSAVSGNGGAFYANNSNISFSSAARIISNTAGNFGGGFLAMASSLLAFNSDADFYGNGATFYGGGFYIENSSVSFGGGTSFVLNNAGYSGGGFFAGASSVSLSSASFSNNAAGTGGGFSLNNQSIASFGYETALSHNEATLGAGFFITSSSISFSGAASFTSNAASGSGGAFFSEDNAHVYFASNTVIEGNTAVSFGGGFYATGSSSVNFAGSLGINNNISTFYGGGFYLTNSEASFGDSSNFIGNRAGISGGGFLAENGSVLTFGAAFFSHNASSNTGGGFSLQNSDISFNSYTELKNNESDLGGGFYAAAGASITFNDYALFSENTAYQAGGAIAATGSDIVFAKADFLGNISSGLGGAVYADSTNAVFYDNVLFLSNASSASAGGGVVAVNGSLFNFNALAEFGSNSAVSAGGALWIGNSSVEFSSVAYFYDNKSGDIGGAAYVYEGDITFKGDLLFSGNISNSYGGALSLYNSSAQMQKTSKFENNTALTGSGGALYIVNNSSVSLVNGYFKDNYAEVSGGAVYIDNSFLVLDAQYIDFNDNSTFFSGNETSGGANAIFAANGAQVVFRTGANTSVEMHDGIETDTSNNTKIIFEGSGEFNLYSDVVIDELDINAFGGGAFNLKNNASLHAGTLTNNADSVFSAANGFNDTVYAATFNNFGLLKVDEGDSVIVENDVNLDYVTSRLDVQTNITGGNFRKKVYNIINYGGTVNNTFDLDNVTINNGVVISSDIASSYDIYYGTYASNWITLYLVGLSSHTNFSSLSGLSFNQKQAARAIDSQYIIDGSDFDIVISRVESFDDSQQAEALAQMSGYFIANVIRSARVDSEHNEIYDRIKKYCGEDKTGTGIWVQTKGAVSEYEGDDNSPNKYKDASYGAAAGYDKYIPESDMLFGVYGKYNSHHINQNPKNEADISDTGVGLYGGLIKDLWEVKALISGSYNNYETTRYIPFADRKATGKFDGSTLAADIEGTMIFDLAGALNLRPYFGIEGQNIHYKSFKEKGADSLDLAVFGDTYVRSSMRCGAGVNYDEQMFSFYLNAEAKYLISGYDPQVETSFDDTEILFKSRGVEEGRLAFGAGAGASVKIEEALRVYVNTAYYAADKVQNAFVNVGLRYMLCGPKK